MLILLITSMLALVFSVGLVRAQVNIHDVAVTSVISSKTVVGLGYGLNVTVTAEDLGDYAETSNVTVYANTTSIACAQNVTLSIANSTFFARVRIIAFPWNTAGFAYGNYTISAYVTLLPGETNTANNNTTGGTVCVSIPGDINGDGKVDIYDAITLASAFGSSPGSSNWNPNADINGDGTVDIYDAIIMSSYFGQTIP